LSGDGERGLKTNFSADNPFKIPASNGSTFAPVFTTGKSLFNLPPAQKPSENSSDERKAESENDSPLQDDVKEKLQSSESDKIY
jgi:hypothetical protein